MKRNHHATRFIELDSHRCDACWTCIEACPTDVLGKVDFLGHRHARINDAEACNGCKRCVRACPTEALIYTYQPVPREQRHPQRD